MYRTILFSSFIAILFLSQKIEANVDLKFSLTDSYAKLNLPVLSNKKANIPFFKQKLYLKKVSNYLKKNRKKILVGAVIGLGVIVTGAIIYNKRKSDSYLNTDKNMSENAGKNIERITLAAKKFFLTASQDSGNEQSPTIYLVKESNQAISQFINQQNPEQKKSMVYIANDYLPPNLSDADQIKIEEFLKEKDVSVIVKSDQTIFVKETYNSQNWSHQVYNESLDEQQMMYEGNLSIIDKYKGLESRIAIIPGFFNSMPIFYERHTCSLLGQPRQNIRNIIVYLPPSSNDDSLSYFQDQIRMANDIENIPIISSIKDIINI